MLERGKNAKIDPNADDGGDDDSGDSAFIYCVTCGHEVPARRAIRHLENCFNKVSARKYHRIKTSRELSSFSNIFLQMSLDIEYIFLLSNELYSCFTS